MQMPQTKLYMLKLSGGNITGPVSKNQQPTVHSNSLLNGAKMKYWLLNKITHMLTKRFHMTNHKIINLGDPSDDKDTVKKEFLEEVQNSHIKPSHKTDQFSCLMQNTLEWSDLTPGGNGFNITKIADLSPEQGIIHSYNHKVIYTTMIKKLTGRL